MDGGFDFAIEDEDKKETCVVEKSRCTHLALTAFTCSGSHHNSHPSNVCQVFSVAAVLQDNLLGNLS